MQQTELHIPHYLIGMTVSTFGQWKNRTTSEIKKR
jgi:hypothetical protein